jgi:hypothetical protein
MSDQKRQPCIDLRRPGSIFASILKTESLLGLVFFVPPIFLDAWAFNDLNLGASTFGHQFEPSFSCKSRT